MMRNPQREIDKTYLSLDLAEERGLIHRDYIAHCFRWSHVVKFLLQGHRYKEAHILDVGCGKEMPLAKTLYVNKMSPKKYVGVDANDFEIPEMLHGKKIPISIWAETDFCALEHVDVGTALGRLPYAIDASDEEKKIAVAEARDRGFGFGPDGELVALPNVLTCFEVLEHVTPGHARRMIQHFCELTSNDVDMFISTPCYNGSAAGNHINEMTFGALGALFEDLGLVVESVFGTFSSITDYYDELKAVTVYDKGTGKVLEVVDLRSVFACLRNYYDTNVLSTILAPLFPAKARNCLWHLKKKSDEAAAQTRMFSSLEQMPHPWSQHPNYKDLAGEEVKNAVA